MRPIKISSMIVGFCIISISIVTVARSGPTTVWAGGVVSDTSVNAPASPAPKKPAASDKEEPADTSNTLYQVTGVVMVIWIGLAIFIFRLDRTLSKLEKELTNLKS